MKITRIGLLVPSTNTSVEADFQQTCPEGVTTHSQRLWIPAGELTEDLLDEMNSRLDESAVALASANVDLIVYGCTSGSFYKGLEWDEGVVERIRAATGIRAFTTSQAVSRALQTLGVRRLSVATPYMVWTNERLRKYLENLGFEVVNIESDERAAVGGHRFINDQDPAEIVSFANSIFKQGADALFCSCTAWRAREAADAIEASIGKPVVTSNQATLWHAYREIGISGPIDGGGGQLLHR
jgi:maleate isomerase